MRSHAALPLVVAALSSSGCSFILTKGPQPEVQPPPPCTTSNAAPIADAIIGGLGAVSLVAGVAVGASYAGESCTGWGCLGTGIGAGAGFGAAILGGIAAAVFIPSAVVGFNRTDACRASQAPKSQEPASPALPESSFLRVPLRGCPTPADAPRLCADVATYQRPSAFALEEAPH